jgi:hypothetical protein
VVLANGRKPRLSISVLPSSTLVRAVTVEPQRHRRKVAFGSTAAMQSHCDLCPVFPNQSTLRRSLRSSARGHDQTSGNESSGQDFESKRPSLAVNYTAHVAG